MSQLYRLAPHARACSIDGLLIFLDLKHDRYCAVSAEQMPGFSLADAPANLRHEGEASPSVSQLLERGIIEPTHAKTKYRAPLWWAMLTACVWTSLSLATRRLDLITASLAKAKLRPASGDEAKILLGFYEAWRPWWPSNRICLFDSLSLCLFLAGRGVRAELVIGVVGQPFAAHAWVEIAGQVVNDDADTCRFYCEIARA